MYKVQYYEAYQFAQVTIIAPDSCAKVLVLGPMQQRASSAVVKRLDTWAEYYNGN
jgi:hypothetical protein